MGLSPIAMTLGLIGIFYGAFLAFAQLGLLDLADVPALLQVQQVHEPDPTHRATMDRALARLVALHPAHSLH